MDKHFLLCQNCEFPNEVKTPYLTLCADCGKPLGNNFSHWKKDHPKASFEEYIAKECISIDEKRLIKPEAVKREKKSGFNVWMGVLMGIILMATILFALQTVWSSAVNGTSVTEDAIGGKWLKHELPAYGFSFMTPYKLKTQQLSIPVAVQNQIEQMQTDSYTQSDGIQIFSNVVVYKPHVGQVNLAGAAAGSINTIKSMPGISDLDYQQAPFSISGVSGFRQDGSLSLKGQSGGFINVILGKGLKLYQISIIFPVQNQGVRQIADKMINSIEIKDK